MLARKEGKGTGTGRSLHSEGKGNGWSQWLVMWVVVVVAVVM